MSSEDLLGHGENVPKDSFKIIGNVLAKTFGAGCLGAKMPGSKNNSPQERLKFLVGMALARAEQKIEVMANPPVEQFHAHVVLQLLRDDLRYYMGNQSQKEGYTIFTQLISNEISAIDNGLKSGCIATSDKLFELVKEHRCVASPSVRGMYVGCPAPVL